MDVLSTDWLHELAMEDSNLISQCQIDCEDHLLDEINFKCFSPEVYSPYISLNNESTHIETSEIVAEDLIANNGNSHTTENTDLVASSSFSDVISLDGNTNCIAKPKDDEMMSQENMNFLSMNSPSSEENLHDTSEGCKRSGRVGPSSRAPLQAQNHILAERKRRERLNQKLISLSALIPGLKKMDKASILEDAIRYIKQLRERVQTLEKGQKKKSVDPTPTAFSVKRPRPSDHHGDENFSSEVNKFDENLKQLSPKIEVTLSDNDVLVRIQCEKRVGVPAKILSEIEALRVNVISSIAVPFGNAALDITIIAQINDQFRITAKDLAEVLKLAVVKLM